MSVYRLFLLKPTIVFTALVNEPGDITYPLDEVHFGNVTVGAYTDIQPGMLVRFLASTPHPVTGHDLGRQRIRKAATSDALYIGRSSQGKRDGEVDLADNATVQVLDLYSVHSKIPRFDPDGTTYKDSDLAYTDQTIEPPPVANTGPAVAATIDADTGVLELEFDASASFATADSATITDYLWDVVDGTITMGTATSAAITATFPAGFRWISLTVTDSNGKTHTARCPVFVRDPEDDECIQVFEIETHRITPQGQQVGVRVRQPIDLGDYPDGTLAMLWYGEPATPDDRSHMQFVGWIQQEPVNQQVQRTGLLQEVTLNFVDVAGRLDLLPGFPQILEAALLPTNWAQMANPTMDRYLHYLLQWHSTVLDVADWTWTGTGSAYPFRLLGSDGQSLYDQVQRRANALVPDYHFTCNRRGQLRTVVDPMLQDEGDRTSTEQATITLADWSAVRYERTRPPRVHWLRSNAIQARTDQVATLFCLAPGDVPGQGEQELDHGEQLAKTQSDLNAVTGHRYARINAPQSKFTVTLTSSDDLGLEPADMTWVRLLVGAGQRVPGQVFDRRGLVQEINIRYDHQRTGLVRTVELVWERETVGTPAVTVIPAAAEPVPDGDWWGGPVEPPPEPSAFDFLYAGNNNIVLIDNYGSLFRTSNFQDSTPIWDYVPGNSFGMPFSPGTSAAEIQSWAVDPFSPLYRGTGSEVNGWFVIRGHVTSGGGGIYRVTDLFGTPGATLVKSLPFHSGHSNRRVIRASFGRYQENEADNPWLVVVSHYDETAATPQASDGIWVTYSTDGGQTWSTETQINANTWTNAFQPGIQARNLAGLSLYLSPRTPGLAYAIFYSSTDDPPATAGYMSTDWGATWEAADTGDLALIPTHQLGGGIHVPWAGNDLEQIVYHGRAAFASTTAPSSWRLYRVNGNTAVDISPSNSGSSYGLIAGEFCIRTYSGNRNYLVACGVSEDSWSFGFPNNYAVFVSDDAGDTWSLIHGPEAAGDLWGRVGFEAAFAGDSAAVLYLWGGTPGESLTIGYSDDFGQTIQDKIGNITADFFNVEGFPEGIIGIAGGNGPP